MRASSTPSFSVVALLSSAVCMLMFVVIVLPADPAHAQPLSMYDDLVSGSRAFLRMVQMFDTLGSVDDDDDDASYDTAGDYQERQQSVGDSVSGGGRNKPSRSTPSGNSGNNGADAGAQERCQQPLRKGVCRALIPRWSYDMASKECKEFKFGGCDGNGNNFGTLRQCQEMCAGL